VGCRDAGKHSGAPTPAVDTGPTAPPPGIPLHTVAWNLTWDDTGLTPLASGGWQLERPDGLALQPDEGWLVLYTLVLEPCEPSSARTPPPHGLPNHPSRTVEPVVLAMHAREPFSQSAVSFEEAFFCEVGFALFRGEADSPGTPESGVMEDLSFWMTGAIRSSPDEAWTPFELSSALAVERDLPLESTVTGAGVVDVLLRPGHLLDGLSLDQEPDRMALDAMANLGDTATATLHQAR